MKKNPRNVRQAGFALVVTLSLMILLTVIAVALLTLSTVSLRSASQGSAASVARNNARLGMLLALGELQKSMGPDTSVSAPASAVAKTPGRPHLTGTWQRPEDSATWQNWRWVPVAGGAPDYDAKAALFKGWLTSSADVNDALTFDYAKTAILPGTNTVSLVGNPDEDLSNNNVSTTVNAEKVRVGSKIGSGKYAWSVFDESVKAPINLGDPEFVQNVGQEISGRFAPGRVRADVLENSLSQALKQPANLISMDTAVIPGGAATKEEFRRRFHDFTTDSVGLLTDTANSGLKVDLTQIFEGMSTDGTPMRNPEGAFVNPTPNTPYTNAFGTSTGAPRWTYIRDHYRKYKSVTETASGLTYTVDPAVDLKIKSDGINTSPDQERLLPVIAKLQLAFSVVSHYEHINDRVKFYNEAGDPTGNTNYGVIHLVYDPIVTLYNPYDVAIKMEKLRVRIWDPPVGFRFTKISNPSSGGGQRDRFRAEARTPTDSQNDGFYSLVRYQDAAQDNANARKAITMILNDGNNAASLKTLTLLPGEVKVFSPRVEDSWNWGLETAGQSTPYAFFDWNSGANFGNVDNRSPGGIGEMGIESVPGWNGQAGLSADFLTFRPRPESTMYAFEKNRAPQWKDVLGGYLPIKMTDDVLVEAKPMFARSAPAGAAPVKTFQVDILAGRKQGDVDFNSLQSDSTNSKVQDDRMRSYSFTLSDIQNELLASGSNPIIEREYSTASILQKPNEPKIPNTNVSGPGGKKPFAMLEMSARATNDPMTDSKAWLYNNPVVEGADQRSSSVGMSNQSYDLRFYPINSFRGFPNGVDIDPDTYRGYFGASSDAQEGSSFVPMIHVPASPMASMGELVHSNIISGSVLPRVVHPFGNSRAHPLIPSSSISRTLAGGAVASGTNLADHSYLLNDSLWDKYYFSSITDYGPGNGSSLLVNRSRKDVLKGVLDRSTSALNTRLIPANNSGNATTLADTIESLDAVERSRELAKYLAVAGPFNLSSTSVDAWRAVLSSLRDRVINGGQVNGAGIDQTTYASTGDTPFVRTNKPLAAPGAANNIRWAGYRALTDAQITTLAKSIVQEITERGEKDKSPAFTLGEFVNRRIGSDSALQTMAGILQTAIDKSNVNEDYFDEDGKAVSASAIPGVRKTGVVNAKAMDGYTSEGTPSMLTQGDLMAALAPIATVRGDTFKIRSYGEATDATGSTILARAWCEVVVQRSPEFVDQQDAPQDLYADLNATNVKFGRRFNIVSFRWLNENEI